MPTCPGCQSHFAYAELRSHLFRCLFLRRDFRSDDQARQATRSQPVVGDPVVPEIVESHEHRINQLEDQIAELQDEPAGTIDADDGADGPAP